MAKDKDGRDIIYLTNVIRLKLELPDVRAAIRLQDKIDKPALIVLDHRGAGWGVYQEFQHAGWSHVTYVSTDGKTNESKMDRFGKALLAIYDGLIRFPLSAPFMDNAVYALDTLPKLKELDLIDSIT